MGVLTSQEIGGQHRKEGLESILSHRPRADGYIIDVILPPYAYHEGAVIPQYKTLSIVRSRSAACPKVVTCETSSADVVVVHLAP